MKFNNLCSISKIGLLLAITFLAASSRSFAQDGAQNPGDGQDLKPQQDNKQVNGYTLDDITVENATALTPVAGKTPPRTKLFYTVKDAIEQIKLTATVKNGGNVVAAGDLPANAVSWTINSQPLTTLESQLVANVSKSQSQKMVIKASIGKSEFDVWLYVIWCTRGKYTPQNLDQVVPYSTDDQSTPARDDRDADPNHVASVGLGYYRFVSNGTAYFQDNCEEEYEVSPQELINDEKSGFINHSEIIFDAYRENKGKQWIRKFGALPNSPDNLSIKNDFQVQDVTARSWEWSNDDLGNDDEDNTPWNSVYPDDNTTLTLGNKHIYATDAPRVEAPPATATLALVKEMCFKLNFQSWVKVGGKRASDTYYSHFGVTTQYDKTKPELAYYVEPANNEPRLYDCPTVGEDLIEWGSVPFDIGPELITLKVGVDSNIAFTVSGGTAPYTWTAIHSLADNWISVTSAGVLHGTPPNVGVTTITLTAKDANNVEITVTIPIKIEQ